jgi:hypothetical protein
MLYMLQIFLVVAIPIFVLAGSVLLSMIAWTEMKDYARARIAMRRIVTRVGSSNRPVESVRAA